MTQNFNLFSIVKNSYRKPKVRHTKVEEAHHLARIQKIDVMYAARHSAPAPILLDTESPMMAKNPTFAKFVAMLLLRMDLLNRIW